MRLAKALRLVLIAALAVLVYLSLFIHDPRWDLTAGHLNTLSPPTRKTVSAIVKPTVVTLFDTERDSAARDLLERCRKINSRFSFRILDPAETPGTAEAYSVSGYGQAVIEQDGHRQVIEHLDEHLLANALAKLNDYRPHLICFSNGHGERALNEDGRSGLSGLRQALSAAGYDLRAVDLEVEALPAATDVFVIAGARQEFSNRALAQLKAYLVKGGSLLVCSDPGASAGLADLQAAYGINAAEGLIIDPVSRVYGGDDSVPAVTTYGSWPELTGFKYVTMFARAQALLISEAPGCVVVPLALTAPTSWIETDLAGFDAKGRAVRDANEFGGPLVLAALATARQGGGRLMVFGDSDFMTNAYLNSSGNKLLVSACLNGLASAPQATTWRDSNWDRPPFMLTMRQSRLLFVGSIVFLPGLMLAALVALLLRRRRA